MVSHISESSATAKQEGGVQSIIDDSTDHESRRAPEPPKQEVEEEDEENELLPEAQPSHPRNNVAPNASAYRQNVLHVYGLDFLKTPHMDEIFGQFGHKFIEWINDSAANIIFAHPEKAKKALEALSFPKVGDAPWRRTPDILVSEDMPPIFLQMRYATAADAKATKRALPKVLPAPTAKTRRPGREGGAARAAEGRLATKRPRPEPTAEERERRQKRAKRFADWLVAAAAAPEAPDAAAKDAAPVAAGAKAGEARRGAAVVTPILEVTQEEVARRKKRLERFGAQEAAAEDPKAAPKVAEASAPADGGADAAPGDEAQPKA